MIRPVESLGGTVDAAVRVPGSKSIANRALVCAALAEGRSVLHDVPDGDDSAAMLEGLARLGISVGEHPGAVGSLTIQGGRSRFRPGPLTLDARLAGTTSRFLTALVALGHGTYVVDGATPLRARPMAPLHDALAQLDVVVAGPVPGHLPVEITGPQRWSGVGRRTVRLGGDVSSQFLSALMMIAPHIGGGLRFELTSNLVSRPYVELTGWVMGSFGIGGVTVGEREVLVEAGSYTAAEYRVEADASSASYPMAIAAVRGGTVRIPGLGHASRQADARFADLLAEMGCTVARDVASTTVTSSGVLRGIEVDLADASDLVPTVVAVALFAEGATRIRGVGFIRGKESDRLGDLATEFARLGAQIEVADDGLDITPAPLHGGVIDPHHDHRLAMAAAVVGARQSGVAVSDPDVVSKSWPRFWEMIEGLR